VREEKKRGAMKIVDTREQEKMGRAVKVWPGGDAGGKHWETLPILLNS